MVNVTPVPACAASPDKVHVLARNASNIGQQLRMDLNKEAERRGGGLLAMSDAEIDVLLGSIQDRAQLLFDRGIRYSKTVLPNSRTGAQHKSRAAPQRWRRPAIIECLTTNADVFDELPNTSEFVLFEAIARRLGVQRKHILILWEVVRKIQVCAVLGQSSYAMLKVKPDARLHCMHVAGPRPDAAPDFHANVVAVHRTFAEFVPHARAAVHYAVRLLHVFQCRGLVSPGLSVGAVHVCAVQLAQDGRAGEFAGAAALHRPRPARVVAGVRPGFFVVFCGLMIV